MKSIIRRYQKEGDYWRIRSFLRDVLILNNRKQLSWDVARFDYWRWHGILNMKDGTLEDDVFIWELESSEIVGVLNREAPGSTFFQIHPHYRTEKIEAEMLDIAERHLSVPVRGNRPSLRVWTERKDMLRQEMLKNRGYAACTRCKMEHQWIRPLTEPIQPHAPAEGYTIRSMGDTDEHHARCWVSWRAFHPNDPRDNFKDGWYINIQRAPLYRRDLDLVAVAPGGELAAFATIWYDDVTRTGVFEPVGTAPEYQRLGMGKAILTEGLIRLKQQGADIAYVSSYTEPAHSLYASVGFKTYSTLEPWSKEVKTG